MNCQNCGAPMRLVRSRDYFQCEYCLSFYFPQASPDGVRVLAGESPVKCPVCAQTLIHASIEENQVLYCENCRGVLVSQPVFAQLVRILRALASGPALPQKPIDPQELERRVSCPHCNNRMETHPYLGPGNVVIDVCSRCGYVWLDQGEFHTILQAPGRDRGQDGSQVSRRDNSWVQKAPAGEKRFKSKRWRLD